MGAAAKAVISPIALQRDEGEVIWFLGVLAVIKASGETTDGHVAIIETLAPEGAGSPLHVHSSVARAASCRHVVGDDEASHKLFAHGEVCGADRVGRRFSQV